MTQEQIVQAARALKIRRLARMPGMDRTAVLLNSEPTHDEIAAVVEVKRALEYAARGMSALVIAVEMET